MSSIGIFEQAIVKLSPKDVELFGEIFRQYQKAPNQKLKTAIVNIFAPQIERRAAAMSVAAKGKISATDYAQDLYLKFLENLDVLANENRYAASALSRTLNETKPTLDTLVSVTGKTKNLTALEEFRSMSYKIDENLIKQETDEWLNTMKKRLSRKESLILEHKLQGKTFDEIGDTLYLTQDRVRKIYGRAIKQIRKNPGNKKMYEEIFYEDKTIGLSKPNLLDSRVFDKIIVSENYKEALNAAMPPDSVFKGAFSNSSIIKIIKNILEKNPDFKLHIKLSDETATLEYINAFKAISRNVYGKNIIEFYR